MGLANTTLSVIESSILKFARFETEAARDLFKHSKISKWIFGSLAKGLGLVAAVITVVYDGIHSIDDFLKGNYGLSSLYFLSALGGSWMIYVLIAASTPLWAPIVTFIALIVLFGTAILIALNTMNDIQKWLQRCLWGILPKKGLKSLSTYPTLSMEQEELKKALGA